MEEIITREGMTGDGYAVIVDALGENLEAPSMGSGVRARKARFSNSSKTEVCNRTDSGDGHCPAMGLTRDSLAYR
jgi:hypothetical protein